MTTPNTAIAMRERYSTDVMDGVTEAVLNGDLKGLPPAVKIEYYNAVCAAVGIDPMARPFEYIPVRGGKEKLYWTAVGAFTLGAQYGASIEDDGGQFDGEAYVVRAIARAPGGRMATKRWPVACRPVEGSGLRGPQNEGGHQGATPRIPDALWRVASSRYHHRRE